MLNILIGTLLMVLESVLKILAAPFVFVLLTVHHFFGSIRK